MVAMKLAQRKLSLSRVYGLLEPGPVVLLATAHGGRENVMAMSWLTMMEFEPPLVGCVVSGRNWSFDLLSAAKSCVIAIPPASLARTVVGVGNCSGRRVDKFAKFGLTRLAASEVAAPLLAECVANLECRIHDARLVDRYNFFILKVVAAWAVPGVASRRTLHHRGRGVFFASGPPMKLPSRMK